MEVISKPGSVRGCGNVLNMKTTSNYDRNHCTLSKSSVSSEGYQMFRLKKKVISNE